MIDSDKSRQTYVWKSDKKINKQREKEIEGKSAI